MQCTDEQPCGLCDVCTLEDEIEAVMSNALYKNCESNKCKGCDHCNNCEHGEEINCCEICSPPAKCGHGTEYGEQCASCDEEDDDAMDRECAADAEHYCKHDISFSDCHACSAEAMDAWEKRQAQQEWNHFHP